MSAHAEAMPIGGIDPEVKESALEALSEAVSNIVKAVRIAAKKLYHGTIGRVLNMFKSHGHDSHDSGSSHAESDHSPETGDHSEDHKKNAGPDAHKEDDHADHSGDKKAPAEAHPPKHH